MSDYSEIYDFGLEPSSPICVDTVTDPTLSDDDFDYIIGELLNDGAKSICVNNKQYSQQTTKTLYLDYTFKQPENDTIQQDIDNICQLTNLEELTYHNNDNEDKLTELPEKFWDLIKLRRLSLRNNSLTTLSPKITNFTNLKILKIQFTKINVFPIEICDLPQLERLEIVGCNLTEIPKEIVKLVNLHTLVVHDNALKQLPEEIAQLDKLKSLCITNNYIKTPPKVHPNCELEGMDLQYVTSYVINGKTYGMYEENELLIWNDDITEICKTDITEICKFTDLTRLQISLEYAKLTNIPDEITNLVNLKDLDLNGLKLNEFPKHICQLSNLELLTLSFKPDKYIIIPDEISNLTNLQQLWFYDMLITSLPESIGKLTKLEGLRIELGSLKGLPDGICNLVNLKELFLRNNKLSKLPDNITNLTKLEKIDIVGNSDLYIDPELFPNCNIIQDELTIKKRYNIIKGLLGITA